MGYQRKNHRRSRRTYRGKLLTLSLVVLCLCLVGGSTLAYLVTGTGPLTNLFTPGKVTCEVNSTIDSNVAQNVTVKNTGTVSAYIRAAVVVNWVDDSGNVSANPPEEGDYIITYTPNSGWKHAADGFWYYTQPVAAGASTAQFIQACQQTRSAAPTGYHLSVEVVASAIQVTPDSVVKSVWESGVTAVNGTDGTLTIKEVTQP